MILTITLNYHHAIILTLRSSPILTVSKTTMIIKLFRDSSKKKFVQKVMLGMIISVLLITGMGNYMYLGLNNNDYALIINGHKITRFQFENYVAWEQNQQQKLLGNRYPELARDAHYIQQLRIKVLSQLRDEWLLQQYAHNLGLKISDEQIRQVISSQLDFQVNGHFDIIKYNNYLNVIGLTSRQYAETMRQQLILKQLLSVIRESEFILPSDKDKNVLTLLLTQQRKIRTAVVNKIAKMKLSVSNSEIRNYYYQNISRFIAPELFRFDYIPLAGYYKINISQLTPIKDSEVHHWYDLHQQDYRQSSQYKYRVIQLNSEKSAQMILKKLKAGADFIAMATDFSVDPISAQRGGEFPWMKSEYTPVELKNAHLQQIGQISEIIKTSVGYLIVRLEDIRPEKIIPFNKVRSGIANQLQQKHLLEKYLILKEKIRKAIDQQSSLKQIEKITGIKSVDTGWFSWNTIPKSFPLNPIIVQDIFQSDHRGSNPQLFISTDHGDYFIRLRQYRPALLIPLRKVHNSITLYITRHKIEQQNQVEAEKLLSALNDGSSERKLNLKFTQSRWVTRHLHESITPAVFSIDPPKKHHVSYGIGKDRQGNVMIIALDKVRQIMPSKEQEVAIDTIIRQVHFEAILTALLDTLRQNSHIRYGEGIINVPK
ncbi:MAG: peptidylprolyl isomerase [Candidatus Dasytiphilus stammeri]